MLVLFARIECKCSLWVRFIENIEFIHSEDVYPNGHFIIENGTAWGCICEEKYCGYKCCKKQEELHSDTCYDMEEIEHQVTKIDSSSRCLDLTSIKNNFDMHTRYVPDRNIAFCVDFSKSLDIPLLCTKYDKVTFSNASCEDKICVRKCCEHDEIFSNNSCVKHDVKSKMFHSSLGASASFSSDTHHVYNSLLTCPSLTIQIDDINLQPNYSLYLGISDTLIENGEYCIDYFSSETVPDGLKALICVPDENDTIEIYPNVTGKFLTML